MKYFKDKLNDLDKEYKGKDKDAIFAAADYTCKLCGRTRGDEFLFGPTHYLRKKIRFNVGLDVHIIDGVRHRDNKMVLCDGCHLSYHLFARLEKGAELGGVKVREHPVVTADMSKDSEECVLPVEIEELGESPDPDMPDPDSPIQ